MSPHPPTAIEADDTADRQAAWREWKLRCALDLCSPKAAGWLRRFGDQRFLHYWQKVSAQQGHPLDAYRHADRPHAWHLLESYAQTGSGRSGKRYKEWLFARAPAHGDPATWLQAIESGASLLMRDVVREQARREYTAPFVADPERLRPTETGCQAVTLLELLPDESDTFRTVASRDLRDRAECLAAWWVHEADRRAQIGVWARAQGWLLSDPALCEWAGCRRSYLASRHRAELERFCAHVRTCYPREGPAFWLEIARISLDVAVPLIFLKLRAEKGLTRFLNSKGITPMTGARQHA